MSIRISDPPPAYCSACHNADADARHVDFDALHDGGSFVGGEDEHYVAGSEDLHVCERCIRDASEVLALKPELHQNQYREIRRQEIVIEALRDQVVRLKAAIAADVPDGTPVVRRPGRPRKQVAA